MIIKLQLPLKQISVNQIFGVNYFDFYKKLGLEGHNGIDFMARNGLKCHASHSGRVLFAGSDGDGGIQVILWNQENKYKTIYYHLACVQCAANEEIKAGQIIGWCDNTGKYTTGDHLHFGLKKTNGNGNTINYNNGYGGAIDPTAYFNANYQGIEFKNKDCYKSNAYHRYFRKERNLKIEIKILGELTRYLKKIPSVEQINACVYGGWDREMIKNDAMYNLYAYITKGEYLNKIHPFN